MLKKIIIWGVVIFVVYFLVTAPSEAASFTQTFYNALHSVVVSVGRLARSA